MLTQSLSEPRPGQLLASCCLTRETLDLLHSRCTLCTLLIQPREVRAVAAQPLQSLQVCRTDQGLLSQTSVKALDTHLKICEDRCDMRDC